MTKVIIIDDHELVAEGISRLINQLEGFELIGIYSNSNEGLTKTKVLKPDLLITDLDMPGINGLELVEKLITANAKPNCILLTMHLDRNTVKKALKLGVEGYILKNADSKEFLHSIKTVSKSHAYYTPKAMEALIENGKEVKSSSLKKIQLLTERELEILNLVVQGLSTNEISEKLFIARRTTETHRKSIMSKLGVNNVAGMVRIAMQEGLID